MSNLKPVDKLNFVELKAEALQRTVWHKNITFSEMKNAVVKHREANPEFVLQPNVDKALKTGIAKKEENKTETKTEAPAEQVAQTETKKEEVMKTKTASAKKTATKKAAVKKTKPVKKAAVKKVAAKKEPKASKEVSKERIAELKAKPSVAKILANEEFSKDRKHFEFSKLGTPLTKHEMSALTGTSVGNISRDLWMYAKGHRTAK